MRAALPAVCALLAAAGCGQKGPLYLPEKAAVVVTPPAGAASGAAPATAPVKPKDKDENSPPK